METLGHTPYKHMKILTEIRHLIVAMIPKTLLSWYRKNKVIVLDWKNSKRTAEEIFTTTYAKNLWGGKKGEFCSGAGTVSSGIAAKYCEMLSDEAARLDFSSLHAVDLGCGDMRIGDQICGLFKSYTGVDIVAPLIESHRKNKGKDNVRFEHLNIAEDPLPTGDVCLIRQVLQHLSNREISAILEKASMYKYVYITEHLPSDDSTAVPNVDMAHGSNIRIYRNSGVYLDKPPFSLPPESLATMLDLEGHGFKFLDAGRIVTVRYSPLSRLGA